MSDGRHAPYLTTWSKTPILHLCYIFANLAQVLSFCTNFAQILYNEKHYKFVICYTWKGNWIGHLRPFLQIAEENNNPRDMCRWSLGWAFCLTLLYKEKSKLCWLLVLLFTRRSPARPRWRGGQTHTVWMPGIAGSIPVARRGFSVMKSVSWITRSNLKARRVSFSIWNHGKSSYFFYKK